MYLTVYRNIAGAGWVENAPNGGTSGFGFTRNGDSEARQEVPYNILYLDSPSYSVGQAITYKIMGAGQTPSYYIYVGQARQSGDASYVTRMPSTLTLLEVGN